MSRSASMKPAWERLYREIIACRKCPRLVEHREHMAQVKRRRYRDESYWGKPVPGFGDRDAGLVIIGLAPAAHGANRTGRMFTGDSSGDWLYGALHRFGFASQPVSVGAGDGLILDGVYITAAARCAPPDNKPAGEELSSCLGYLVAELLWLRRARLILALGRIAFDSFLESRGARGLPLLRPAPRFLHGALYELPEGGRLLASYHPSRQNTQTGRLTRDMWHAIFECARDVLREPPRISVDSSAGLG